MYPDLPRKQRETRILQDHPAIFIVGIGWTLADGYPHEMRAADYDDWVTETVADDGRPMHGLNGDILVWNPVTKRRHELSSMGIRVDAESLRRQLELTGQLDWLSLPYHRGDRQRRIAVEHRRRDRPVADADAPAQEGTSGRGQRHRLAEGPQGHVRREGHPRHRVTAPRSPTRRVSRVEGGGTAGFTDARRVRTWRKTMSRPSAAGIRGDEQAAERPAASHRSALPTTAPDRLA